MSQSSMSNTEREPGLPAIDVLEHGGKREGARQALDRRLFVQLLVVDAAEHASDAARHLGACCSRAGIPAVIYADTMSPRGIGLLTWSESPSHFVEGVRKVFEDERLARLAPRRESSMIGRTYGTGHEPDLEWALLRRPIENVTNEACPWHVWYPLRRTAAFARLDGHEQSQILREHAQIGMAYGAQGLAMDVRLACHGMDAGDNEFVIGLVGRDLYPLSHLVQAMRKTRQTSEFIEKMGPFFVGHVVGRI
jgi:chlorite dismutase